MPQRLLRELDKDPRPDIAQTVRRVLVMQGAPEPIRAAGRVHARRPDPPTRPGQRRRAVASTEPDAPGAASCADGHSSTATGPAARDDAARFDRMGATANEVLALVRSHHARDDATFQRQIDQIAAAAARKGHTKFARSLHQVKRAAATTAGWVVQLPPDLDKLMIETVPQVSLADVVASDEQRFLLDGLLEEQHEREMLQNAGFPPARRALLHGPPGTGKTMTAAALAHDLDLTLRTVRLDGLIDSFLGQSASNLRKIFDEVHRTRAVYFLDEIDAVASDRGRDDVGEARRIVNSLLMMLDEAGALSVVVAATNYSTLLDHALRRRFDIAVRYDLPTAAQAQPLIAAALKATAGDISWPDVVQASAGHSHAALVRAAETAAKRALMRGDGTVNTVDLTGALAGLLAAPGTEAAASPAATDATDAQDRRHR